MNGSVLIVDDDARIRASLSRALSQHVSAVHTAETAEKALATLGTALPDVILSDVRMPGLSGLELLALIRERAPSVDVVLMTAYDDLPTVAEAMRAGAVDFLIKPLDLHQLRSVLDKVFGDRAARTAAAVGAAGEHAQQEPRRLVGRDPRMVEIFKVVGQVAASRATVIIRGESGTGKELIARAIHDAAPQAGRPFVAVNCTALPSTLLESELFGHVKGSFTGATNDRRGRFALAGDGTVFLDEIGDTTLDFQSKLLRVLQEHEFYPVGAERAHRTDARIIAATHRDLEQLVARGEFREDLYYRLRVVEIVVPPLRERLGDIALLADHLVAKAARAVGREPPILAPAALDALLAHSWPGNVRELENCLTRAVVLATGDVIHPRHLALGLRAPPGEAAPRLVPLADIEREHVLAVLAAMRGHRARTAQVLGISRPRLARLLKKYGITDIDQPDH